MSARVLLHSPLSKGAVSRAASAAVEGSARSSRCYNSGASTFLITASRRAPHESYPLHARTFSAVTTTSNAITNAGEGFGGDGGTGGAEELLWGVPEVLMATMLGVGTTTSWAVSGQDKRRRDTDETPTLYGPTAGPLPSSHDGDMVPASSATTIEPVSPSFWDSDKQSIHSVQSESLKRRKALFSSRHQQATAPEVYNASVGALQGLRPFMEDDYCIGDGGRFVAVFDGHGGSGVSSLLRDQLYTSFSKFLEQRKEQRPSVASRVKALRAAFNDVEQQALKRDAFQFQGSTAVAVVVHEEQDGTRTLVTANVGDSRAVLSRSGTAIALTRDHKPSDEMERHRILAMGGEIRQDKNGGPSRVKHLAISRSIGDRFAKPFVTSDPEVKQLPIAQDGDEFVVLASDGLWDVMSNQEVVSYVHDKLASSSKDVKKELSNELAYEAISRGTSDNVCVAIVWLK